MRSTSKPFTSFVHDALCELFIVVFCLYLVAARFNGVSNLFYLTSWASDDRAYLSHRNLSQTWGHYESSIQRKERDITFLFVMFVWIVCWQTQFVPRFLYVGTIPKLRSLTNRIIREYIPLDTFCQSVWDSHIPDIRKERFLFWLSQVLATSDLFLVGVGQGCQIQADIHDDFNDQDLHRSTFGW